MKILEGLMVIISICLILTLCAIVTIAAINKGARSGKGEVGDGKIFVMDLVDCVRISSGERGNTAIG
jgi:nitrogen regulatory protein PII